MKKQELEVRGQLGNWIVGKIATDDPESESPTALAVEEGPETQEIADRISDLSESLKETCKDRGHRLSAVPVGGEWEISCACGKRRKRWWDEHQWDSLCELLHRLEKQMST